ncbi:hypothetical protein PSP6_510019 [Paraburkholderia tropica]|nr:hypothetical protein PSP6_510019 [Paraburkholderia tropica]
MFRHLRVQKFETLFRHLWLQVGRRRHAELSAI